MGQQVCMKVWELSLIWAGVMALGAIFALYEAKKAIARNFEKLRRGL